MNDTPEMNWPSKIVIFRSGSPSGNRNRSPKTARRSSLARHVVEMDEFSRNRLSWRGCSGGARRAAKPVQFPPIPHMAEKTPARTAWGVVKEIDAPHNDTVAPVPPKNDHRRGSRIMWWWGKNARYRGTHRLRTCGWAQDDEPT